MNSDILNYHEHLDPAHRAICDKLYTLITQQFTGIEHKIWHAHPVWFADGNPIVGYSKLKAGIRLMFWSGQSFDEPELEQEGSFKAACKLFTEEKQINEMNLKRWLDKSLRIQWDYKNLIKRKGKLEWLVRPGTV